MLVCSINLMVSESSDELCKQRYVGLAAVGTDIEASIILDRRPK